MGTRRVFEGLLLAGIVILRWLCILALGKQVESAERKLVDAHNVLFGIAAEKCCCDPDAIIIEAPGAPELVGEPMVGCHACQARALLEAQCAKVVKSPMIFVRTGTREEFEAYQEINGDCIRDLPAGKPQLPKPGDPEYEALKARIAELQSQLCDDGSGGKDSQS